MGLVDRVLARMGPRRAWPVGVGSIAAFDRAWGHDDERFSPESYGDYIATSNDIYSVVSARARLLSGLELKFFVGRGQKKKEVNAGPAVELFQYVNSFWTAERLARMDEICMGLWGETYWALEPPNRDNPLGEIWWLKPSRVRPGTHPNNYLDGYWYHPEYGGTPIWFDADEIVWQRYPNPIDEFSALSPLAAAKLAADTATAMMRSNEKMFSKGTQIAGLIVPPADKVTFSPQQAEDLEKALDKRFSGPDNAHKWAVLRYEAKFQPMSLSPKDAEFVAGLNLSFRQVCRAYGMQSGLHNDLVSNPGDTNALERMEWSRAMAPDAKLRAAEIREQYLPRFKARPGGRNGPDNCEYDFSAVPALQESATETWARDAQALDRMLITINEWRQRNGMPDVNWGDRPWAPLNKQQIDENGKLPTPQQGAPASTGLGGADNNPVPPDDEVNPVNKPETPRLVDHTQARQFLAAFPVHRHLNGTRPGAPVR